MGLEAIEWKTVTAALAADWVEMRAVADSRRASSRGELLKSQYVLSEAEDEHGTTDLDTGDDGDGDDTIETEIANPQLEAWLNSVADELAFRAEALGDSYPFELEFHGEQWTLRYVGTDEVDNFAQFCYVLCLLVTAVRFGLIQSPPGVDGQSYAKDIDKCLQIVAYFAAAELVRGEAYWFGWPRPDNSTKVRDAVNQLFTKMGVRGEPAEEPQWTHGREKDGGVDIVAWRNFGDGFPGRLILFGQVASGRSDWKDKSVMTYVDSYFKEWLRPYEQRNYVPAHFIAWPQYIEEKVRKGKVDDYLTHRLHLHEKTLGLIIDRLRLTELTSQSVASKQPDQNIGEPEHVELIQSWSSRILGVARG